MVSAIHRGLCKAAVGKQRVQLDMKPAKFRYTPHGRRCSTAPARALPHRRAAPDSGRKGLRSSIAHAPFELPPAPVPQTTVSEGPVFWSRSAAIRPLDL